MASSVQWRLLATLGFCLVYGTASAEGPSNAELQRQIEELKQQIRVLSEKLSGQPAAAQPELSKQVETQDQQIKAQQQQIEALAKQAEETKKADWLARTKIGGYGELHYNNLKDDKNGGELEEFDFHRFVLFLNHTFNDKTRFFSELEVEHAFIRDTDTNTAAGGGTNPARGEVALEQAYIEHDLASDLQLRAGLQLVPIGILNETHEPPTFYGVERNPIETRIIPSTYRVGGLGLNGKVGSSGWSYDVMLHEGLKVAAVTGNSAFGVRDARQRNAQADAEDLAATGRIKYNGIPGLTVGAAIQYNRGVTQGNTAGLLATDDKDQDAVLAALNAEWQRGPFTARALYARFDVDSDTAKALNRDLQQGYYLEAGYRFLPDVGAFVRYNVYDDIRRSIAPNDDFEVKQTDVGINYWLNPNVVFKADYQLQSGADDDDGINLGVGYQF